MLKSVVKSDYIEGMQKLLLHSLTHQPLSTNSISILYLIGVGLLKEWPRQPALFHQHQHSHMNLLPLKAAAAINLTKRAPTSGWHAIELYINELAGAYFRQISVPPLSDTDLTGLDRNAVFCGLT
jgi:hypothetical protein